MTLSTITLLLMIGFISGIAAGLFGVGGGILIVPGLIYLAGYSQHAATSTGLAILLPRWGARRRAGIRPPRQCLYESGLIVAAALFVGGWCGALIANQVVALYLRLAFGIFIVSMGCYLIFGALRRLSWI